MSDPDAVRQQPAPSAPAHHALSGGVRAVSGVTLLSRLGGLARDIVLVRAFGGDTALASAFNSAFAIPNLFRRLFGEGALSAAFIPQYATAAKSPAGAPTDEGLARAAAPARTDADRLASLVLVVLGIATSSITIIVEVVLLILLLFSSPNPDQRLSIGLIMVMLPFMPLVCLTAIKAGMLQVHGKFAASMSGPLILNAIIIIIGLWSWLTGNTHSTRVAYILAFATTISGLTQLLTFRRLLRPHFRLTLDASELRGAAPAARETLRRFLPVMLGLGSLQLNAFVDMLIAMWPTWIGPTILGYPYPLDERANAILTFTQRLYQFPLGVFGVAVATAAFPLLARSADNSDAFLHTLRRGIRLSLFIGLPATVGLSLVRIDATAVLFGFGDAGFSPQGLQRSADVLLGFATGIFAYSINHLLSRAFYAKGDTRTPMRVSLVMVLINVIFNFTLIFFLREAGLAWSTSICAFIQMLALLVLIRKHLRPAGEALIDSHTARGVARIVLAATLMGFAVWGAYGLVGVRAGWRDHAFGLSIAVATGLIVFTGACFLLRTPELRWLVRKSVR